MMVSFESLNLFRQNISKIELNYWNGIVDKAVRYKNIIDKSTFGHKGE
jgi:hypothetical protein